MKSDALILGDLSLDIEAWFGSPQFLGPLSFSKDVTVGANIRATPGGSAWLLANALLRCRGHQRPLILAAIGEDAAGAALARGLQYAGLGTDGIQTSRDAATSIIAISHFDNRQRLMVHPHEDANDYLEVGGVEKLLRTLNPDNVSCVWISGYCAMDVRSKRARSVRHANTWSRKNKIPVILDLVPHDFRAHVGDIQEAEARIGMLDGIVGELETLAALGYWSSGISYGNHVEAMRVAAERASLGRHFAVVQHRADRDTYVQALAVRGEFCRREEYPVPAEGLRGLGDAMAVDALGWLGILSCND